MSRTGPRPQRYAPKIGEHTAEILCELGYSDAEVDAFRRLKVILPAR